MDEVIEEQVEPHEEPRIDDLGTLAELTAQGVAQMLDRRSARWKGDRQASTSI